MGSFKKYNLTIFSLTMITVGSVDSIRNLPATALFGSQLIAFFILGAICFLIPAALVSAELASAWAKQGGIYVWVKEAFGKKTGFLAIWLQWVENVIWYPAILAFVSGTIGYLINPDLANNPLFLCIIITCAFWGATLVNLSGMQSSARFSSLCTISGLLVPMTLIIGLGVVWIFEGNPLQISLDLQSISPQWTNSSLWVSLSAIILSFCGIEIATVHANDVENPQKAFPRALIYSVVIILSTLILGSLAIAIVLPHQDINLVAGIMQAFDAFFEKYDMGWILPLIALMLVMGGLGGVSNWIIAPTKGLVIAAKDDNLPPIFATTNKNGAPTFLLVLQAILVTLLSALFLFMPGVNSSYWLLTAMAVQLYMLMYILMFAAAIKLRIKAPNHHRPFKIPGGMPGLLFVALVGIIGALTTFVVSFQPPQDIVAENMWSYRFILVSGLILMCLPPFISSWYMARKQASVGVLPEVTE